MKVKYLRETLDGLSDEDEIWFWVTTPDILLERIENMYEDEKQLNSQEYKNMIDMLEADDYMSETIYQSENYILEKIIEKRKLMKEGK